MTRRNTITKQKNVKSARQTSTSIQKTSFNVFHVQLQSLILINTLNSAWHVQSEHFLIRLILQNAFHVLLTSHDTILSTSNVSLAQKERLPMNQTLRSAFLALSKGHCLTRISLFVSLVLSRLSLIRLIKTHAFPVRKTIHSSTDRQQNAKSVQKTNMWTFQTSVHV